MKCSEIKDMLSAYADGEITGSDAKAIRAHVAECSDCAGRLETLQVLQSQLKVMMDEPMEAVDLSDLVMGSLVAPRRAWVGKLAWAMAACIVLACLVVWQVALRRESRPMVAVGPKAVDVVRPGYEKLKVKESSEPVEVVEPTARDGAIVKLPVAGKRRPETGRAPRRNTSGLAKKSPHTPVVEDSERDYVACGEVSRPTRDGVTVETVEAVDGETVVTQRHTVTCTTLTPDPDAANIVRPPLRTAML